MKRQLLFVHGGGEGAYEENRKLAASLQDALGGYEVQCPKMPDEDSPRYAAWRDRIASELAKLDGEIFLVGHSLGAPVSKMPGGMVPGCRMPGSPSCQARRITASFSLRRWLPPSSRFWIHQVYK
jgi:hypothetical protein